LTPARLPDEDSMSGPRVDPSLLRAVSYCLGDRGAAASDAEALDLAERLYAIRDEATAARVREALGPGGVAALRRAAAAMRAECTTPRVAHEAARWEACEELARRIDVMLADAPPAR
jgi:hypothetical protein